MAMHPGIPVMPAAVWHPGDAEEAYRLKVRLGRDGIFVSGGTLLRTQWESGMRTMAAHLIDLSAIGGLKGFAVAEGYLEAGSQTTLAICRRDPQLQLRFPLLAEAVRVIAAPSVRNLATLGGNIVSAVGDSIPALLVYDAELAWYGEDGLEAWQPLADWLEGFEGGATEPDRLLVSIRLPLEPDRSEKLISLAPSDAGSGRRFAAYHKVGRREAFTPSVVTVAIAGEVDAEGGYRNVRLAAGGGQTVPKRFPALESWLEGKAAGDDTIGELYEQFAEQFDPKPDAFATADYRKRTAAYLVTAQLWNAARGDAEKGD